MIFEENVPGCLVEGVNYETEMIAGLLEAGDTQQQEERSMIGTSNDNQQNVDDNARQSARLN